MKNDLKSKAFLVFCEFGPERRIPRLERIANKFPSLKVEQIEEWINEFQYAERVAYDVAIEHRREGWKSEHTIRLLSEKIPDLNHEAVNKLLNQACYFATHDGY